jgi:hypothetical protein
MHKRLTVAFLLVAAPSYAQKFTGEVRGTVMDPSRAVIVGATVTLSNEGTGVSRTMETTSSGAYQFPDIPVGTYDVEAQYAGFKTAIRTGIKVNVTDVRGIDVTLEPGALSESVSVEVPAVSVQTVGGDVSGLVRGEQVRELPLNGRNFIQLTLLQPGVTGDEWFNTTNKGLMALGTISVSGGSTGANLWTVDGADIVDHGSNKTIVVYPSVDAIEEFKIQRNNYGAEFGQAGAAQVSLVTRGGTNEFHGSGYYYARRGGWNSTDYFLKQAGQDKPPLEWDDYGGTFGGPIVKDKLHFFFSYEKNKDAQTDTRAAFVPTEAERNGDFSGPGIPGCSSPKPIDPLTGQPFSGNVIPADRIDPGGRLMMDLMSLPNTTPTGGSCNNWVEAVSTPVKWDEWNGRLDWAFSSTARLMVRYTQDSWVAENTNLWGDDPFPTVSSNWNQPGRSLVTQLSQNIGSTMVNTLTFSYSANRIEVTRGGENPGLVDEITAEIPTFYPADQKQKGGAAQPLGGSIWPYGGGTLLNQAPWLNNEDIYAIKDDFSALLGKHFLKAGVLFSYNKKNEEPANTSQESVQFRNVAGYLAPDGTYLVGANAGNPIANYLLSGTVWNTGEIHANLSVQQRWKNLAFYVNDSYRATPRLTIDLGLRASHFTPPYEADDRLANFVLDQVDPALGNSPCNGMVYPPGANPCPGLGLPGGGEAENRSLVPVKLLYLAPRLGFAWDVLGNGKTAIRGGLGLFYLSESVAPGLYVGQNPPLTGTGAITRTAASAAPVIGGPSADYGAPGSALEQRAADAHNWQWNLSVQHEFFPDTVLEVAYVGNQGRDLVGVANLNEVPPENRVAYAQTGDPALRPLDGIAGIGNGGLSFWTHDRHSIYHGLQTGLVSRFGQGSVLSLSYTWSKVIADTGIANDDIGRTDSTQPWLDRARGAADRRHVFTGSLVWMLPGLEDKSSFVRNVLGDWQVTTIVQAGTGYPLTVWAWVPGWSGWGEGNEGHTRPDVVAGVPCSVSGASEVQWLNPDAWTVNGHRAGETGTSGRNVCDGPGSFTMDLGLFKNIRLGSNLVLQLRGEVFNVFNTVNFVGGSVNSFYIAENVVFDTGDASTATQVLSATPPGNFGQFSAVRPPRTVQLGMRLTF